MVFNGLATLYMDGRSTLSDSAFGRLIQGVISVVILSAGQIVTCQYFELWYFCRRFRLFSGNGRDDRANDTA